MDKLDSYRHIICEKLTAYTSIVYANGDIENEAVFDKERDRYLIVSNGWSPERRIHGCLIHVEINNGKIWIQRDGTEDGIANELLEAGIPKQDIVLGFHEPEVRPYTGFAVA